MYTSCIQGKVENTREKTNDIGWCYRGEWDRRMNEIQTWLWDREKANIRYIERIRMLIGLKLNPVHLSLCFSRFEISALFSFPPFNSDPYLNIASLRFSCFFLFLFIILLLFFSDTRLSLLCAQCFVFFRFRSFLVLYLSSNVYPSKNYDNRSIPLG